MVYRKSAKELNEQSIDSWFQNVLDPVDSNEVFEQFGLQSSIDVLAFLKSKVGQGYKKAITDQINSNESQKSNHQMNRREKSRRMAMLMLGLNFKNSKDKKNKSKVKNQAIVANQKKLSNLKKPTQSLSNNDRQLYSESLKVLSEEIDRKEKLLSQYETRWQAVQTALHIERVRQKTLDHLFAAPQMLFELNTANIKDLNIADAKLQDYILGIRAERTLTEKNGILYLIPKGQDFESLSLGERQLAQSEALDMKPKLSSFHEHAVQAHQMRVAQTQAEFQKFVKKTALLQESLMLLKQQCHALNEATQQPDHLHRPTPKLNPLEKLDALMVRYYQMASEEFNEPASNGFHMEPLRRQVEENTKKDIQDTPEFNARYPMPTPHMPKGQNEQDITRSNRIGAVTRLPEEFNIKPTTVLYNSHSTERLLQLAQSMSTSVTREAATSKQFHQQEMNGPFDRYQKALSPSPGPATPQNDRDDQPQIKNYVTPTPFSKKPG